jgi:hypothetical protein
MDWGLFFERLFYAIYCVVAFLAGAVAGVVVGTLETARCYVEPLLLVGASRFASLPERRPEFTLPADADPAVPDYLHGPAVSDLTYVAGLVPGRFRDAGSAWEERLEGWVNPDQAHERPPGLPATVRMNDLQQRQRALPATAGFGCGLVVGVLPGAVLLAAVAVTHALTTVVLALGWRAIGLLVRFVDSVLLRVRNIRMLCVACFEAMPYPAYHCPRCRETHWDIRPGPLGILWRTCRCGERMPTLLLLGSASLDAQCPGRACGAELPHGPGTSTELVLPVLGATAAGKTRLMYALVVALEELTSQPGVSVGFADDWTARRLADARVHLDSGRATAATPPALQRGLVLRMRVGRRRRLIQLFDAAGERFASEERTTELRYISRGRTFVLVIDPLSVDGFWNGLTPDDRERLGPLRPVGVPQPALIYQQSADRILDLGGSPKRSRLAVVFSRADVLGASGREDLEVWAAEMGLGGLLRAARLDFGEVTLFHTAAVVRGARVDPSISPLLTWLLKTPEPAAFDEGSAGGVAA